MKLKCNKCGHRIDIPEAVLDSPSPRVECGQCGARFRLKPKAKKKAVAPAQAPEAPTSAAPAPLAPESVVTPPTASPPVEPTAVQPRPAAAPQPTQPPSPTQPSPPIQPTPTPAAPLQPANESSSSQSSEDSTGRSTDGSDGTSAPPTGPLPPAFDDGELIAQRYRIIRFLAQGGMGQVFEAEDLELRQKVAIKTVTSPIGADPAAIDRFKREIALARRVTHPNVCRIFDLGQHQPLDSAGQPKGEGLTFLSMELLEGETLSQCIERRGRLKPEQALPVIKQMTAALDAAHKANVVHRDFKSENVFLVPDGDEGSLRVVVTDFGVARAGDQSDSFANQVTGLGIVGTPSYMAPEQIDGSEVTSAADIYALGIVIYELVTGQLPFESPNPLTTAVKRLKEPPPPPHIHAPDLPGWWERAILKCLERQPTARYATASEVTEALAPPLRPQRPQAQQPPSANSPTGALPSAHSGALPSTSASTPARVTNPPTVALPQVAARQRSSARGRWLAAALVLLLIGGAAWWLRGRGTSGFDASKITLRPSIAAISLAAADGADGADTADEQSWQATALRLLLRARLDTDEVRWLEDDVIQLAAAGAAAATGTGASAQWRNALGADYLLTTAVRSTDQQLEATVVLQSGLQSGEAASREFSARASSLPGLSADLAEQLGQEMGTSLRSGGGVWPETSDGIRLLASATQDLEQYQPQRAVGRLREAIDLEPDSPRLHQALAEAAARVGDVDTARAHFAAAINATNQSDELLRSTLTARMTALRGSYEAARDQFLALWQAQPDEIEFGLQAAAAAQHAGLPGSARLILGDLRRLPGLLAKDPRIDLAASAAAEAAKQIDEQLDLAQRATHEAEQRGLPRLAGQGRLAMAMAQLNSGDPETALQTASQVLDRATARGDRPQQAKARQSRASAALDLGLEDDAEQDLRDALEIYRGVQQARDEAHILQRLAVIQLHKTYLDDAAELYRDAEAIFERLGDPAAVAEILGQRAAILTRQDQLADAVSLWQRAQRSFEDLESSDAARWAAVEQAGVRAKLGEVLTARNSLERLISSWPADRDSAGRLRAGARLASLRAVMGEIELAQQALDEAAAGGSDSAGGNTDGSANENTDLVLELAGLQLLRGETAQARSAFERVLDQAQDADDVAGSIVADLMLARLALSEDLLEEAEDSARRARANANQLGDRASELLATALLARSMIAAGNAADARTELADVSDLLTECQQPLARFEYRFSRQLRTATRNPAAALNQLAQLAEEVANFEMRELEIRVRLAWATLALEHQRTAEARQQLQQLHSRAVAAGFNLYGEQAAALLN